MYKKKKFLCVIPARIGSKGLPKKNLKKIRNIELFKYPLFAAQKAKYIDHIVVNTDSKYIASLSKKMNSNYPILRPKKLSGDKVPTYKVLIHSIDYLRKRGLNFDYVICLEPTSPLTTSKDLEIAIKKLVSDKKADSCISLSEAINFHPSNLYKVKKYIKNAFQKKSSQIRRQELNKIYFIDGSLYISKISSLIKYKNFVSGKVIPYFINKIKSFEIDDEIDFQIVKMIIEKKYNE